MHRFVNEILRTVPSFLYPIVLVAIAHFYTNEIALVAIAFVMGFIGAMFFRAQQVLGFLGLRLALLHKYYQAPARELGGAFLIGSALYLIIHYRGYSLYRLQANATFVIATLVPVLAAFLFRYVDVRISALISTILAAALMSVIVRKVRGTIIERLLAPFGASIGGILATYFEIPMSFPKFRIVSFFLFGIVPLLIALSFEARTLLALRDVVRFFHLH